MADVLITPASLHGAVNIPPSKSAAHRMLICAALAQGKSRVTPFCTSQDIRATVGALRALGANIAEDEAGYTVCAGPVPQNSQLDFCESGSTARFLLPVAAALGANATMAGRGRLPARPMDVLTRLLREHGVTVSSDHLPMEIAGRMRAGQFALPGNISSQYISGLLLCAPLMDGDTEIHLTSSFESVGYVDMTIDAMRRYGVSVETLCDGWRVAGSQRYRSVDSVIEGDWSQAAFFMSAAAIGGDITICGLDFASGQGDMAALDVFGAFGAKITLEDDRLHIQHGTLRGITVNAADIPDMVPAIAATAAFAEGKTVIHSAERLRIKESDRIKTTLAALRAMGIQTEEKPDGMIIYGGRPKGGVIDGAGDHRIVMAFSVAAAFAQGVSTVTGAEAVSKSYPEFFKDFMRLEGKVDEIEHR